MMFESPDYPSPLNESIFNTWFEKGRASKIPYAYLLVLWDELDTRYFPVFIENRKEVEEYKLKANSPGHSRFIAAYDLFSETRIA
jgi:hypothetical protein